MMKSQIKELNNFKKFLSSLWFLGFHTLNLKIQVQWHAHYATEEVR